MTREEGREITLKRIRQSIARLLNSKGYENIKVREICKEAGVSIGTFYNYFDSKDAIIEDTINLGFFISNKLVRPEILEGDILQNLYAYIGQQVGYIETLSIPMMIEVFRMFLYRNGSFIFEPESTGYQTVFKLVQAGQEKDLISKRLTAEEMTESVIKIMLGNCYSWCLVGGRYDVKETVLKEVKCMVLQ